jgi:BirA family biotin operon repressor/biotin-[acetyl-CoA-carboxylase] ligase
MRYDGLAPADLAARIRAPGCLVLPRVTSTLDMVHELAAEGAPSGTVVLADEQVVGRGREGRRWHSPPGAGILLGYLHRPAQAPIAGVLALRVGMAVGQALAALGFEPRLKWPNDVVMGDKKVGGILCEARTASGGAGWVGIGVGLNVRGPLAPEVAPHGAALDQLSPAITRVAVLEELIPRLHQLGSGASLTAEERAVYRGYDWLAGRELVEPLSGRASGVDPDGALVVETDGGRRRVLAGSVVVA